LSKANYMLKYKISQLQLQLHWLTVINIEIVISPCVGELIDV